MYRLKLTKHTGFFWSGLVLLVARRSMKIQILTKRPKVFTNDQKTTRKLCLVIACLWFFTWNMESHLPSFHSCVFSRNSFFSFSSSSTFWLLFCFWRKYFTHIVCQVCPDHEVSCPYTLILPTHNLRLTKTPQKAPHDLPIEYVSLDMFRPVDQRFARSTVIQSCGTFTCQLFCLSQWEWSVATRNSTLSNIANEKSSCVQRRFLFSLPLL